jgi:hypothetical protein
MENRSDIGRGVEGIASWAYPPHAAADARNSMTIGLLCAALAFRADFCKTN